MMKTMIDVLATTGVLSLMLGLIYACLADIIRTERAYRRERNRKTADYLESVGILCSLKMPDYQRAQWRIDQWEAKTSGSQPWRVV